MTTSTTRIGRLAKTCCGKELPLKVYRSYAGFYIGTWDEENPEEGPCTRESEEYFRTREQAEAALTSGNWTQRQHP